MLQFTEKEIGEVIDLTEKMCDTPGWVKEIQPFANRRMEIINAARSRPASTPTPDQCESCMFTGIRECMYHGYPDEVIPKSCSYKIGKSAVIAPIEAQMHNKQHDATIRNAVLDSFNRFIDAYSRQDEDGHDYVSVLALQNHIESLRTTEAAQK